jgi:hypothetical protein
MRGLSGSIWRSTVVLVLCMGAGLLSWSAPALAAAPVLGEESVDNVASGSATLLAQINPEGSETTYRFEYGTSMSYDESIPVPDGLAGAGTSTVEVQAHPQDLLASTVYHYRVVAENAGGKREGPDQTFTTQTPSTGQVLPDGREWELVSPPNKDGFQAVPADGSVIQAAEDGSAIAYTLTGPLGGEPAANLGLTQVLSRRGSSGWSSQDISPPQQRPELASGTAESEYLRFSSDLSHGLVEPFGSGLLSPGATERTLYVRDNTISQYEGLVTSGDVLPGTKFGEKGVLVARTATPDLTHVVFESLVNLTGQGKPVQPGFYYYEWTGGRLQLIDELPPGDTEELNEVHIGAEGSGDMRHAISDDGSRVFWTVDGGLFMRDVPANETIAISGSQGVEFQGASSDGSVVFFTNLGTGDLYAYDVPSRTATLLTGTEHAGETGGVQGAVLGASEDGSYVYIVASGVLSENENVRHEKAVPGADNLYVLQSERRGAVTEWKTSFIAGLSAEDSHDWAPERVGLENVRLERMTSRVSPDGRYVTFMSERSLTGYDNVDVNSAQRDEEVYVYDSSSGRLECASCDPSGARPVGRREAGQVLSDLNQAWFGRWVAASVPGWLEVGPSGQDMPVYQPQYLSDSGRVFFDSLDGLVPQDTNGAEDVYQYEPIGVGDCASSSPAYSASSAGCISLMSGGKGGQESVFVDASASGNDVFFVTSEGLVPGDVDGVYDVYDAHVCSVQAPCPVSGVVSAPPCDTADSCKGAPMPQPSIFGVPASATFVGQGNVVQGPSVTPKPKSKAKPKVKPKPARCAKGKRRSHGRCKQDGNHRRAK